MMLQWPQHLLQAYFNCHHRLPQIICNHTRNSFLLRHSTTKLGIIPYSRISRVGENIQHLSTSKFLFSLDAGSGLARPNWYKSTIPFNPLRQVIYHLMVRSCIWNNGHMYLAICPEIWALPEMRVAIMTPSWPWILIASVCNIIWT